MKNNFGVDVRSEIGVLEGVILHTPGPEVENMTPQNAERALYSDILNLSVAGSEYRQLSGVLNKFCQTFQVKELLSEVLTDDSVRYALLADVCKLEGIDNEFDRLLDLNATELARQLMEGSVMMRNNLTRYLSNERFSMRPLHNFFFTRDASISMYDQVLIGRMANRVRERESLIMECIFRHHASFGVGTLNPLQPNSKKPNLKATIEGGDVLIARDDVLLIGTGCRTSTQGIDFIIESIKAQTKEKRHIVVQELPDTPESFIHLDMVFTFLDKDTCMVYEPLILGENPFRTIHIEIENGKVSHITTEKNILTALSKLGFDLKPVACGGTGDQWIQEREQWHSGANFFALAPGKVIGYERNENTIAELHKNGFEVVPALDIINNKTDIKTLGKSVITIAGSELARGGGGCRCMTMPVKRRSVEW